MKAMVVVAHPDDCLIFAYSFVKKYPAFEWTICYLTYDEQHQRAQEFAQFWQRRNVATQFLGFVDDWHDIENNAVSFDAQAAEQAIAKAIQDQDLVVTHNAQGDYGHIHHRFVHQAVIQNHNRVVTFQGHDQGNEVIVIDPVDYTADEFPTHADIVVTFHKDQHRNEYHVPDAVRQIIGETQ